VLKDVTFLAESGRFTALTGRNGAGKTTLLSCLLMEKRDFPGDILLDGQSVKTLSARDRAKLVACLPQHLPRPHIRVRELVSFGRAPYAPLSGKLDKTDWAQVDFALHAAGMEEYENAFVDTLSGGESRKAFFAMTLAQDTPILLLDEPTASLDPAGRFEFLDLIDSLKKETGKTILAVMHDWPEVLRYADYVITLDKKTVFFSGTPEECLKQEIPRHVFRLRVTGNKEDGFAVTPPA